VYVRGWLAVSFLNTQMSDQKSVLIGNEGNSQLETVLPLTGKSQGYTKSL